MGGDPCWREADLIYWTNGANRNNSLIQIAQDFRNKQNGGPTGCRGARMNYFTPLPPIPRSRSEQERRLCYLAMGGGGVVLQLFANS